MTPILDDYLPYVPYSLPKSVHLVDKSVTHAIGEGMVRLFTMVKGVKCAIDLHHTLLVPSLANSLFSVKTINYLGYSALFRLYWVFIENPGEITIAKSKDGGILYDLHIMCGSITASTA